MTGALFHARALALCAAAVLALPAGAQVKPAELPKHRPALEVIARWTEDYRRLGAALDPDADDRLMPALEDLRKRLAAVDPGENGALLALCDLAGIAARDRTEDIARGRYIAGEREAHVRALAKSVLRSALDAQSGQGRGHWLATHVLAGGGEQPIARRIAAAESLAGRQWEPTLLPLLEAAQAPERGLRDAAVRALSGWKIEAVDRFLGNLTLRALSEADYLSLEPLLAHFESRELAVGHPAVVELAAGMSSALCSPDWRCAARRIPLTRILPNELALPRLVEALALWHQRGVAGQSSRRIEALLVVELERRSGLQLGMSPDRWSFWWRATRTRDPEAGGRRAELPPGSRVTQAAFFGLRPWTDRVVFVIDRSGSMAEPFGTAGSSRYAEALRQLGLLLRQLGPRTRFNVILFSDQPRVWSADLRPATPAMIDTAVAWARGLPPHGATYLRPAILEALEVDARGVPDLEALEADTVIVLCDGATAEGAGWVSPLLSAVREGACVRFDCVQIGRTGNGTLESLAAESGGQCVLVDP